MMSKKELKRLKELKEGVEKGLFICNLTQEHIQMTNNEQILSLLDKVKTHLDYIVYESEGYIWENAMDGMSLIEDIKELIEGNK